MNRIALVSLLLLVNLGCADEWIEYSIGDNPIECPFVLILDEGKYEVLNDCFGMDPRYPVVESGSYKVIGNSIEFYSRKDKNDLFFDTNDSIVRMIYSDENDILELKNGLIEIKMVIFDGFATNK